MQEIVGDLFSHSKTGPNAICITTNGFVTRQGVNVMGRGCAAKARERYPGIEVLLGRRIKQEGNQVHLLTQDLPDHFSAALELPLRAVFQPDKGRVHMIPYHLVSFPTKPDFCSYGWLLPRYASQHARSCQEVYPGWMAKSDLGLIRKSAVQLAKLTDQQRWQSVVLPRPGCGAGELNWEEVRPILSAILDDRFYAITFA